MKVKIPTKNGGAALVISLVILTVITLFAVVGMGASTLQMKLTSSAKEHASAFEAAESVLKIVENQYVTTPVKTSQFVAAQAGCTRGICFSGKYAGDDPEACLAVDPSSGSYNDIWNDDFWRSENSGQYFSQNYVYPDGVANAVKYIVEFMCFSPRTSEMQSASMGNTAEVNNNLATTLRITVHATGSNDRANVNLQSVIKINRQ